MKAVLLILTVCLLHSCKDQRALELDANLSDPEIMMVCENCVPDSLMARRDSVLASFALDHLDHKQELDSVKKLVNSVDEFFSRKTLVKKMRMKKHGVFTDWIPYYYLSASEKRLFDYVYGKDDY